jgi:Pilus formation protein N terminal region
MKFGICAGAAGACVSLVVGASLAAAGTPLTVQMDQSQLMMLNADPGTIIIGNPSIADVSLNGRQLFIHGHAAGETNLMVFDGGGNKIADFDLSVSHDTANSLVVYKGNATNGTFRYTYSCAPNCEFNMMAGDDSAAFEKLVSDNRAKTDYATGVKTSDLGPKNVAVSTGQ